MEIILAAVAAFLFGAVTVYMIMKSKIDASESRIEQAQALANSEVHTRVEERLEQLREETVEKTKRRVERELREELHDEVREDLSERLKADIEQSIKQDAEKDAKRLLDEARHEHDALLKDAELKTRELTLVAQKEAEDELRERRLALDKIEERLSKRENVLDSRGDKLDSREKSLEEQSKKIKDEQQELETSLANLEARHTEVTTELERIGRLTSDEARQEVIDRIIGDAKIKAAKQVRSIEEQAIDEADRRAKKVISIAVQRYAGEFAVERCVSVVQLPGDEMKGRIIGREGRNIRALEAATGIDVIIDDTPEAVARPKTGFAPKILIF